MTEPKYYTPSIEEFRVGFEYEYLNRDNWIRSEDFSNEYAYEDSPLYGVIKDIEQGHIRVKYLDRQDIESVGWEVIEGMNPFIINEDHSLSEGLQYAVYNYRLAHYPDNTVHIYQISSDFKPSTFFEGKIKNKSELITLMKQIGIA